MNKNRRKDIAKLSATIEELKGPLTDAVTDCESISEEEQESYDNLPEALQEGEQGERMQAAIEALGEAKSKIEELLDSLDEITGSLETAAE